MFHGYSVTGAIEEAYLDMASASDAAGFLFAYGDGTVDPKGFRFWNATDACCDDYGIQVDDVQYFDAIVDDVQAGHSVDARRIFVMGHSNGGFMSHRLACDRAQRIAAIVSLAGAQWDDPTRCAPVEPVSVLEIHGDADTTIRYGGGSTANADAGIVGGTYPSAHTTVATWAQKNGCTGALADTGQTLDVDALLPGNETKVETYGGCPASIDVQLWTIQGGIHEPNLNRPAFGQMVWGFMSAHARP
jgi:polyhydroxybutyrate depolymerase